MTELERQLTVALKRLCAQYEMEQRLQSERVDALRQQLDRQTVRSETLQRLFERLDGRMTRLAEHYGTLAETWRGRWI